MTGSRLVWVSILDIVYGGSCSKN